MFDYLAESYGWTFDYIATLSEREIHMIFEIRHKRLEKRRNRELGLETVDATDEEKELFEAAEKEFMARKPDPSWMNKASKRSSDWRTY